MSRCYWGIVGYGVSINSIYKYIDDKKVLKIILGLHPDIEIEEDISDDDWFYDIYNNFAEFLCDLDETNSLSWQDTGDGGEAYFLYEPKYPWMFRNDDPMSYEEIEERIINILEKIIKDNTDMKEIRNLINHINDYGCG